MRSRGQSDKAGPGENSKARAARVSAAGVAGAAALSLGDCAIAMKLNPSVSAVHSPERRLWDKQCERNCKKNTVISCHARVSN